jgi:TPR repeat protein
MADCTAIESPSGIAATWPASPGPTSAPRLYCSRCATDVSALPLEARFCNRCGLTLPERTPLRAAPAPEPFQPPLILLAYAKALFNLGWRYETALGSRRNLREAARCYGKAARLGDAAARARALTHTS